jgi:hypothetical protein
MPVLLYWDGCCAVLFKERVVYCYCLLLVIHHFCANAGRGFVCTFALPEQLLGAEPRGCGNDATRIKNYGRAMGYKKFLRPACQLPPSAKTEW